MTNENLLRDLILDHILENFCDNCPALGYESDTGAWCCPCGEDVTDSACYRSAEWDDIERETDNYLENIRFDWPASK